MPEEIEKLKRELKEAQETIRIQEERIAGLSTEVEELRHRVRILQIQRPKLKPESLMTSFTTALRKMQEGLKMEGGRVDYVISKFDTDLKVNVTLDDEGEVNFQLPKLDDVVPFENLSTLRFSMMPSPRSPQVPSETIEIPNLVGMDRGAAGRAIESAGLTMGQVTERPSVTASGTVIRQDPEAYARTEKGGPVDLVISQSREAEVPDLIGLERDNAVEVLTSSGLTVGTVTEKVSDSPAGTVIGQGIAAGTVVPMDTAVDLTLARPGMTEVPDLIGMPVDQAQAQIKEARLRVGRIVEQTSARPKGTVIGQTPAAKERVVVNSPVNLVVAKPKLTPIPDITGMEREGALRTLEDAGLEIGSVIYEASVKPPGTVIGVEPEPGVDVSPGKPVTVRISRSETVLVPDLTGLSLDEARRVAAQHDLKVDKIIRRRSKEPEHTVIGQSPDGGSEVPAGTAIRLTIPIG